MNIKNRGAYFEAIDVLHKKQREKRIELGIEIDEEKRLEEEFPGISELFGRALRLKGPFCCSHCGSEILIFWGPFHNHDSFCCSLECCKLGCRETRVLSRRQLGEVTGLAESNKHSRMVDKKSFLW